MKAAVCHLVHHDTELEYYLYTSSRKTMAMEIKSDGRLNVRVPFGTGSEIIEEELRRRWVWINRHKNDRRLNKVTPPVYQAGELHWYLGKQYRLNVSAAVSSTFRIEDDKILFWVKDFSDQAMIRKRLFDWYRKQAIELFTKRIASCWKAVYGGCLQSNPDDFVSVRRMKRTWGSCSRSGNIILNSLLVKADLELIDYVITHELCHLTQFNHGKSFYRLLSTSRPQHKLEKQRLDQLANQLLVI